MSAYIAKYELDESGDDLREVVLARDSYWSPALDEKFDRLVQARQPEEPMLQGWYHDGYNVQCMASTNQPYKLS